MSAARFEADATSIVATEFVTLMDEAANARMASRADAAKQGMVFTSADLAPVREAEALPAPGDRAWGVAPAGEDACPLEPVMRKQLARLVLEHEWSCADETSRRVARYLWEPQLLDAPPPPQTIRDLRADFPRFNARKAGALFARFRRELPRRLLAEHFGVAESARSGYRKARSVVGSGLELRPRWSG